MMIDKIFQGVVFIGLAGGLSSLQLDVSGLAIGITSLIATMLFCVVIPNTIMSLASNLRLLGRRIKQQQSSKIGFG